MMLVLALADTAWEATEATLAVEATLAAESTVAPAETATSSVDATLAAEGTSVATLLFLVLLLSLLLLLLLPLLAAEPSAAHQDSSAYATCPWRRAGHLSAAQADHIRPPVCERPTGLVACRRRCIRCEPPARSCQGPSTVPTRRGRLEVGSAPSCISARRCGRPPWCLTRTTS